MTLRWRYTRMLSTSGTASRAMPRLNALRDVLRIEKQASSAPLGFKYSNRFAGYEAFQRAKEESERCLLCHDAPCDKACPAGTNPSKFIRSLRFDNPLGGAETILDNNPLGGVCGTVCPVSSLCEGACTRRGMPNDSPVQIGLIQRFLHDFGIANQISLPPSLKPAERKSVAVIGAGPAGLSCAAVLAKLGAAVTVFDRHSVLGGVLSNGISPARLPSRVIEEDVQRIRDLGVKFQMNTEVSLHSPLLHGFDFIYYAGGMSTGTNPLKDRYTKNVVSAIDFLRVATDRKREKGAIQYDDSMNGQHVVVIGAGSVAMDAAATAKMMGAAKVTVVCLEPAMSAFPADEEEIELALKNDVDFLPGTKVAQLLQKRNDNGDVVLSAIEVDSPQDPTTSRRTIKCSTLIFAVGQELDVTGRDFAKALSDVPTWIQLGDTSDGRTRVVNVFAGGDCTHGPVDHDKNIVVHAVREGKMAAFAMMDATPSQIARHVDSAGLLEMEFCGIKSKNPFFLASSPVANSRAMIAKAFDLGWGGAYYKTLNLEKSFRIYHPSPRLGAVHADQRNRGGIGLQNLEQISDRPINDNLDDIRWLRQNYPNNVLAVSIMGYTNEDWFSLARMAEDAGAQILELNFSCPQMARSDAGHHVGQSFDRIEEFTSIVKREVQIPVIAKMTPNLTDMVPAAKAALRGGADGISAINTMKSISHINLSTLGAMPSVVGRSAVSGFSGAAVRPMALRFVLELAKADVKQISGIGGISTWEDAMEFILLGATNLQVCTSIMLHGYRIVEDLSDGMVKYLEQRSRETGRDVRLRDLVGGSLASIVDPAQLDVTHEVVARIRADICVGCGQCQVSCRDGANQAISLIETHGNRRVALVDRDRCIGCTLCQHVCPVADQGCINFETRERRL